ncbi:hypothetical protein GGR58DRAFT_479697 [Xylaria digitata]|nr:hypothetical protein GGR58DRAFT_479697 [Xylaria digitata]
MSEISDPVRPLTHTAVLVFGLLPLSCNLAQVARVRRAVVGNAHNSWILKLVSQLPQLWTIISTALPSLQDDSGYRQVLDLAEAFRLGRPLGTPHPLPNKVLIPLVVIFHLTQYIDFLGRAGVNVDETWKKCEETVGFCTGLLSAFTIAASANKTDFQRHGAVAIRLGLLVGMVVDARETPSELNVSKSLRTGWSSAQNGPLNLDICIRRVRREPDDRHNSGVEYQRTRSAAEERWFHLL